VCPSECLLWPLTYAEHPGPNSELHAATPKKLDSGHGSDACESRAQLDACAVGRAPVSPVNTVVHCGHVIDHCRSRYVCANSVLPTLCYLTVKFPDERNEITSRTSSQVSFFCRQHSLRSFTQMSINADSILDSIRCTARLLHTLTVTACGIPLTYPAFRLIILTAGDAHLTLASSF
jgi:hypothetical protein